MRSGRMSSFKVTSSTGKSEIISGVSMKGGDKQMDSLNVIPSSKFEPTIMWDEKKGTIDRHLLTLDEGLWNIDEQMDSTDGKAHVFTKMEPPTKQEPDPFVKTETRVKEETCDFPKREKVESFVKAEPLVTPKIEKSERFGKIEPLDSSKIETTKPYDFSNAKTVKLFGFPLIGSTFRDEKREILLLQLSRTRDFIRLLLSYPMRTVQDDLLKAWIREASNRNHSLDDLNRLLSQKPLKCFQGLLPMYMLEDVEDVKRGWSPEYADSSGIPEDILSLAANLAVDQLIQTLLFEDDHVRDIHHVLLSTRDTTEKRLVKEKVESVLKD